MLGAASTAEPGEEGGLRDRTPHSTLEMQAAAGVGSFTYGRKPVQGEPSSQRSIIFCGSCYGSMRPVRTPLVTTGLGFYNPPNTAKENRAGFRMCPRYAIATKDGRLFREQEFGFHSIFGISQEH